MTEDPQTQAGPLDARPGHGLSPRAPSGWQVEAAWAEDPETQAGQVSLDGGSRDPGRPLGRPRDLGVSPFHGDQPPVPLRRERGEVGDRTPG